ncbi:hypothetical protein GCM10010869_08700 [Mesorhizobium tianshanense]|uniref:Nuclease-like protein n=2 Tax=Mesorhizobium tianshanense TaxID=39844 RepID=A0A562NBY2_9HYPH|nr:nuclease-like protein [Mesorhizobium tianshanense]GLS35282.1 hypothetical protein GCM10010869_08700 [Mesorhizobium tianshanense]
MNNIVRFGNSPKKRNPAHGKNSPAPIGGSFRRRRNHRNRSGRTWAWAIVALIAPGLYAADQYQFADRLMLAVTAPRTDTLRATFPYCTEGRRVTCVVDGDTFWLSGERIRIADIDTPELSPPRCEAERLKGEAAKRRLRELLNAGPFSLVAGWRDEDQHGRKLRTVTRDGRSIGDTMIDEGLARRWNGKRRSWCG